MGDQPTGDQPTGDQPTGDQPTGDQHEGDQHEGDQHEGDKMDEVGQPPARGPRQEPTEPKRGRPRKPRNQGAPQLAFLTEVQRNILEFIEEFQNRHSIAPTHREIRERFNYSSYGTVYKHLKLLQQKGFLRRDWNQKRGLELLRTVSSVVAPADAGVPFLGLIAAGQPIEALPGHDRLGVPEQLFEGSPEDHYVLKVVGESMIQEGIFDGDFVVVLRREQARPGEMVVALVGGTEATLKRFYPEGQRVRLQPANPNMEPLWVAADQVRIQGVVVGLMRKY